VEVPHDPSRRFFFRHRNGISGWLEMGCRQRPDDFGRRLRDSGGRGRAGQDVYRRHCRLGCCLSLWQMRCRRVGKAQACPPLINDVAVEGGHAALCPPYNRSEISCSQKLISRAASTSSTRSIPCMQIIRLRRRANQWPSFARPVPFKRGATRSSRVMGAGCDGRGRRQLTSDVARGRRKRVVLISRR
jgi:hypothetical protein